MYFGKNIDVALQLEVEKAIENVLSKCKTFTNTVAAVPKNVETLIVTFTVLPGRKFIILGGNASAMTDCTFRLYIDDILFETKRTAWTDRNIEFTTKQKVSAGSIIKITGDHNSHLYYIGYSHDLTASLIGVDISA
jgi:hypothetical protein